MIDTVDHGSFANLLVPLCSKVLPGLGSSRRSVGCGPTSKSPANLDGKHRQTHSGGMRRRLLLSGSLSAVLPLPAGGQSQGWFDADQRVSLSRQLIALADQHRVPEVSVETVWRGMPDGSFATGRKGLFFQAASISKVIAALSVMRLVERGTLPLDAPINSVLRSWQLTGAGADEVTPRLLLAHRAGTNVAGFPGYPADANLPTLIDILNGAPPANTPRVRVERPPGATYLYSGGGTTVLQQLVADVAGQPFDAVATELVLQPVAMSARYTVPPAGAWTPAHDEHGQVLPGNYRLYPELAAAGLWCTALDLSQLIRAFGACWRGDAALISPAAARLMTTQVASGPTGLGFFVRPRPDGVPLLYHYGVNAGFRSVIAFAADASFGLVIMTNGEGGRWLIPAFGRALFDARSLGDFPLA